jgi:DNA-binding XRE family transcriptional regulator
MAKINNLRIEFLFNSSMSFLATSRYNDKVIGGGENMIDLKAIRTDKNMTQQRLADEIHCARTVIANIETGLAQPSIPTAKALGKALGFNWWQFFEDGGDLNGANSLHGARGCKTPQN